MSGFNADKPNILLLVMDATRADHFSSYGYHRHTTPHLDKIAARGVVYEQAISPAIWTLASFSSMFTGLYVSQHGTTYEHQYLEPRHTTLAQLLQAQGYQTALYSPGGWISEPFGFQRGFETFQNYMYYNPFMRRFFKKTTRAEKIYQRLERLMLGPTRGKMTFEVDQGLRRWFDNDRRKDKPYFAVGHFVDPHWPWYGHPKHSFRNGKPSPRLFSPNGNKYVAGVIDLTDEQTQMMVDYYDGEVAFLDDTLGRLLDKLQADGHLDNTLVIITADHGEHLGEHHLMGHKMSVYEDLLRVPLILYHPELFAGGRRVGEAVQSIDFYTTIMELIGLHRETVPNKLLGRSLLPDRIKADPRPLTYSEFLSPNTRRFRQLGPDFDYSRFIRKLRTIRMRDSGYKFIWASDNQHELYNLKIDPHETTDLAAREPGMVSQLQAQLDEWLQTMEGGDIEHKEVEMDEAVIERLRDLGYLE